MTAIQETSVMAPEAIRLTTTLNRLKQARACADRYRHLVEKLGGVAFDHEAPINLLTILEHNGIQDCLWALCATAQNCDKVARLMAVDFAEAVLPIFERERPGDDRPRKAIAAARAFAHGETEAAASAAASAAFEAASSAASRAAARAATWAATGITIWAAASAAFEAAFEAASSAASRAAAEAAQAQIIGRYLLP